MFGAYAALRFNATTIHGAMSLQIYGHQSGSRIEILQEIVRISFSCRD